MRGAIAALVGVATVAWSGAGVRGESMSIPPAAFVPTENTVAYVNAGHSLSASTSATGDATLNAPIQLPNGSKITKVKMRFVDQSTQNISIWVRRCVSGNPQTVVQLTSTGNMAGGRSVESGTLSEVIDHASFYYYIELFIPRTSSGPAYFDSIVITYDPPAAAATCPGDNNGDRRVDSADLSVLLANFGRVCGP